MNSKQVIIMRKDLKMRRGKEMAQAAHASIGVILNMMEKTKHDNYTSMCLDVNNNTALSQWLLGQFKKIVLYVNSEGELLDLHQQAKDQGLPTILITDSGYTEFGGVPTHTCIAIGPAAAEDIDKITGGLKLA